MTHATLLDGAFTELIAGIMRMGRKCPEVSGDILETLVLIRRIQALSVIDPEFKQAEGMVERLRNPPWDLDEADYRHLATAADAIARVCAQKKT